MKVLAFKLFSLLVWLCLCMPAVSCFGQSRIDVACSVSADTCYAGDGVDYVVNVTGASSPDRPTIELPTGLSLEFVGGSDRSSRFVAIDGNGRKTERVDAGYVFQFRLIAGRPGQYFVPAPKVKVNGKEYDGTPVRLRVIEPENDDNFAMTISVVNDSPYIGEPVTLKVRWQLAANVKNISIAALPGQDAFELATPHDRVPTGQQNDPTRVEFQMFGRGVVGLWSQETIKGQTVRVLTIEQVLVPKEAGKIDLGPMSIAFDAVVGQKPRSFFDAPWDARDMTRRVVSRSNAVTLRVRSLPEADRPADFGGLVGEYSIKTSASAAKVGVGDPLTLTATITGPDPLGRVELPVMDQQRGFAGAFKVSPEGWHADTSPESNPRLASISIRAAEASVSAIPSLQFAYFDPKRGEYRVARSEPISLSVRPTKVVTSADGIGGAGAVPSGSPATPMVPTAGGLLANSSSVDVLRNEAWSLSAAARSPMGVTLLTAPIAGFAAAAWIVRRAGTSSTTRRALARERRRATAAIQRAATATGVSDALHSYVGALLGRDATTLTAEDSAHAVAEQWPMPGRDLLRLLRECDASTFGDTPANLDSLRARALEWLGQIVRSSTRVLPVIGVNSSLATNSALDLSKGAAR